MIKYPINEPYLEGNELKYLQRCIQSGWISSEGPFVSKFEQKFCKSVNRKYGIAVSSGTAALDICFKIIDLKPGDEIIVPTFTIISCLNGIIAQGAKPIFVDLDPVTWNMNIKQIENKISKKTKAILVVHIYHFPVEMYPILKLKKKYNLKLIEDSAEMHGQKYLNKPCGSFGDLSTFSFYSNKNITTGEGGMIVTNNKKYDQLSRYYRNLCFSKKRFIHKNIGWNYRFTNMQGAIGLAQLEKQNKISKTKREIGKMYIKYLEKNKNITIQPFKNSFSTNIFWVFGILINNKKIKIKSVLNHLSLNGIATRRFFYPLHLQPLLPKKFKAKDDLNISENFYKNGFYVSTSLKLKMKDIKKICKIINDYTMKTN